MKTLNTSEAAVGASLFLYQSSMPKEMLLFTTSKPTRRYTPVAPVGLSLSTPRVAQAIPASRNASMEQLMKKVSSLCGERKGWQGGPQPPCQTSVRAFAPYWVGVTLFIGLFSS
jgi:hypothetical protein